MIEITEEQFDQILEAADMCGHAEFCPLSGYAMPGRPPKEGPCECGKERLLRLLKELDPE